MLFFLFKFPFPLLVPVPFWEGNMTMLGNEHDFIRYQGKCFTIGNYEKYSTFFCSMLPFPAVSISSPQHTRSSHCPRLLASGPPVFVTTIPHCGTFSSQYFPENFTNSSNSNRHKLLSAPPSLQYSWYHTYLYNLSLSSLGETVTCCLSKVHAWSSA